MTQNHEAWDRLHDYIFEDAPTDDMRRQAKLDIQAVRPPKFEDSEYMDGLKECIIEMQALMVPEKQRIVCAAVKMADGIIFTGIRHFSCDMRLMITLAYYDNKMAASEQGFVDQWGNFLTRQEAFHIALRNGQYRPYEPYNFGTLYSEDLY